MNQSHKWYLVNLNDIIFKKWMMIEGVLKTLRENNITVKDVHFLVQHQPLSDPHLDFSVAWPLHGFINSK